MILRRTLMICWLGTLSLCSVVAHADERWCAVAGSVEISLDDIECFVATDGEYTMNIVLKSGMVLSNVSSVSFAVRDANSVDKIVGDSDMLMMNNMIHITRASGLDAAAVMDMEGRAVASAKVTGGECDIDISGLQPGVYILILGNRSIKFTKR